MADETGHLPRGPGRMFKATVWSLQGLRAAWLHESSFRLEVYLFVVLAPLRCGWATTASNGRYWLARWCWCFRPSC